MKVKCRTKNRFSQVDALSTVVALKDIFTAQKQVVPKAKGAHQMITEFWDVNFLKVQTAKAYIILKAVYRRSIV